MENQSSTTIAESQIMENQSSTTIAESATKLEGAEKKDNKFHRVRNKSAPKLERPEKKDEVKYRGVRRLRWNFTAEILHPGPPRAPIYLGTFKTAEEATRAYDQKTFKWWGHRAISDLNFPDEYRSLPRSKGCVTSVKYKSATKKRQGRKGGRHKIARRSEAAIEEIPGWHTASDAVPVAGNI